MSDEQINQTQFLESTHAEVSNPAPQAGESPASPTKKPPFLLYLGTGGALLFILVLGVTYFIISRSRPDTQIVATPQPTQIPIETSGIQAEIAPFLTKIRDANPENDEHPFPPVDFSVRMKEPGAR